MKIYVEGYYGVQNLGDDYILMAILESLTKISDQIKTVTVSSLGSDCKNIFFSFPAFEM